MAPNLAGLVPVLEEDDMDAFMERREEFVLGLSFP
jgi:hypothetical protein